MAYLWAIDCTNDMQIPMWLQNELRATVEEIKKIELDNEEKTEISSEPCSGNSTATLIGKDENLLGNELPLDSENAKTDTEYQNGSAENLLNSHKSHLDVIEETEEDTSTVNEGLFSTKAQLLEVLKEIAKLKEENSKVRVPFRAFFSTFKSFVVKIYYYHYC